MIGIAEALRRASAVGGIALRFPSTRIAWTLRGIISCGAIHGLVRFRTRRGRPVPRNLALPRGHFGIGPGIRLGVAGPILELAAGSHVVMRARVASLAVGSCSAIDATIDPRGAPDLRTAKAACAHCAVHRADWFMRSSPCGSRACHYCTVLDVVGRPRNMPAKVRRA
jgi:hypothetical protein